MPTYVRPRGIGKRALDQAPAYCFSEERLDPSHEAPDVVPCTRCAQSIALRDGCDKNGPERCNKCKKGNRGQCTEVPPKYYGRVAALKDQREVFEEALEEAGNPPALQIKNHEPVRRAGLKLARMQRTFTKSYAHDTRLAARQGEETALPAKRPTSTADFLALILREQRSQSESLRGVREEARRRNDILSKLIDSDEDDEDEEGGPAGDGGSDGGDDNDGDDGEVWGGF